MRKPFLLRRSALCVATCIALHAASAATINSSAKDASGKPAAGVLITLQVESGKQVAQKSTDTNGVARFADLPAGRYTLTGSGPATSAAPQDVEVSASGVVDVTIVLLAAASRIATVTVTATRLKEAQIAL